MLTIALWACLSLVQAPAQDEQIVLDTDSPPRLLKQKKPSYPDDAFRKRVQGVVVVEYVIDVEGRVKRPKILESIPGLDQAAIKVLEKWRFAPARKDGKAVATIAQSPIAFCIGDDGCSLRMIEARKK
jgi:TonB family protein